MHRHVQHCPLTKVCSVSAYQARYPIGEAPTKLNSSYLHPRLRNVNAGERPNICQRTSSIFAHYVWFKFSSMVLLYFIYQRFVLNRSKQPVDDAFKSEIYKISAVFCAFFHKIIPLTEMLELRTLANYSFSIF